MKSFANFISEAFDKPYPFELKKQNKRVYTAGVTLPDKSRLDIFIKDARGRWVIIFKRDDSIEVTGEGDAQRIFATVLAATKKFIEMEDPTYVSFSAAKTKEQQSRSSLYKRLVKRFANQMGYESDHLEKKDETVFILSKKDREESENNFSAADMMRRRPQQS